MDYNPAYRARRPCAEQELNEEVIVLKFWRYAMDIGRSFTFVPEDEDWLSKLGLGALIAAVPILNFAWTGYLVDLMRNVAQGVERPLPQWSDLAEKFMRGLVLGLAGLIYGLPALLVACVGFVVAILPAIAAGDSEMGRALGAAGALFWVAIVCLLILFGLALSFYFPAVFIHFSRQGTFGACFQVAEIFAIIRNNLSDYLTAWGVTLVVVLGIGVAVSIVSAFVGWVPCIGWLLSYVVSALASAWGSTVYAHLFGQVGRGALA